MKNTFEENQGIIAKIIKEEKEASCFYIGTKQIEGEEAADVRIVVNGSNEAFQAAFVGVAFDNPIYKSLFLGVARTILKNDPNEMINFKMQIGSKSEEEVLEMLKKMNGGQEVHDCENCDALESCPLPQAAEYLKKQKAQKGFNDEIDKIEGELPT